MDYLLDVLAVGALCLILLGLVLHIAARADAQEREDRP